MADKPTITIDAYVPPPAIVRAVEELARAARLDDVRPNTRRGARNRAPSESFSRQILTKPLALRYKSATDLLMMEPPPSWPSLACDTRYAYRPYGSQR